MKKKVLALVLTAVMCVTVFTGMSIVSASAVNSVSRQGNMSIVSSITLGKGEKCYIDFYLDDGCTGVFSASSSNSNIVKAGKVTSGSNRVNYSRVQIEGKNVGTTTIKVTASKCKGYGFGLVNKTSGTCKVTVKPAPTGVSLNTKSLVLGKGENYTLSECTNSGSYANSTNLVWSSSNSSVAEVIHLANVNKAYVIAKKVGTAYITVKTYNGKTATCKLTVKNAPSSISLNKTSITLSKGKTYTLTESTNSGSYANNCSLQWTSSNTKVVTVSKGSGNRATVKAIGKGTAYITVKTYNGKTAKCKITVK